MRLNALRLKMRCVYHYLHHITNSIYTKLYDHRLHAKKYKLQKKNTTLLFNTPIKIQSIQSIQSCSKKETFLDITHKIIHY